MEKDITLISDLITNLEKLKHIISKHYDKLELNSEHNMVMFEIQILNKKIKTK